MLPWRGAFAERGADDDDVAPNGPARPETDLAGGVRSGRIVDDVGLEVDDCVGAE